MAGRLAPFDRTGKLNRTPEQQQLFGQCGLAGIRVGDDGKGTALVCLLGDIAHKSLRIRENVNFTSLRYESEVA